MRPDGTRVRNLTPIVQALPHIMPRRFDAQNWASDYVDEDIVKGFIRRKRREGQHVTHMSVLVAAYYKAALEHPKVNYFIMNRKVYRRNHFCFSFVILKTRADGTPDETTLKIFLEPEDDVFTISRKIKEHVEENQNRVHNNNTDRFANLAFRIPGLARLVFGLAYHLDLHGLLPRRIIDLSPFHTSLFITSGLHQHQLHLPPLLRVRHHQRLCVHGQAGAGPPGPGGQPEKAHAPGGGHGRAHRHGHRVLPLLRRL